MWLDHSSLQFTWRQTDINSIESSIRSSKFITLSSEINNSSVSFLVWRFRWRRHIVSCSSCSSISVYHKVSSRALLFLNLRAASTQFCCSFWCFAHAAISAAEKAIDLSALFLERSSSFFQYLERDNDESESDHERLSEEDSDRQESEDNWDSEDENCQEVEGSSEVEDNRESSTFNEMRARLRRRSGETARSKRAARSGEPARSVVFGCSARVVGFLRLPDALERVRRSSRGRFWLRRWGISNKNGRLQERQERQQTKRSE